MCKYFFLLRKLLLPIIKIWTRTAGLLPTYETRTRHVPDDRPPEIAIFRPPKLPIFKIRVLLQTHPKSSAGSARPLPIEAILKRT